MKTCLVGVLIYLCFLGNPDASAADNKSEASPSKVFQSALSQVKAKTTIPILLPSEFPSPIKEDDIHVVNGSGDRSSYDFTLYYEKGFGDAAYVGGFSGEANGKLHVKGKQVSLASGITGYFWGRSCGGSCSPSHIYWRQNNVLYTILLKLAVRTKAEEEQALILAANSAIRGGAR